MLLDLINILKIIGLQKRSLLIIIGNISILIMIGMLVMIGIRIVGMGVVLRVLLKMIIFVGVGRFCLLLMMYAKSAATAQSPSLQSPNVTTVIKTTVTDAIQNAR